MSRELIVRLVCPAAIAPGPDPSEKFELQISVPGHTLEKDVAGEVDGSARGIQLKGLGSGS